MATKIRLQRGGTTNRPFYRFVVTPETSPRDSNFIEKIGTFDPLMDKNNPERMKINKDRVLHWLSVGAIPSERVALLITKAGIANDNPMIKKILKRREQSIEARKAAAEAKKRAEEAAAKAEADKAAAEAAAAAAPAEAAPAETPAA
jgi:small subunit ribosomal protein S16